MTDVEPPSDAAEVTSHRLQLPRATDPADVLAMIRNIQPGAQLVDGRIALEDGAALLQDTSPRGRGRWNLEVRRDREDPPQLGLSDARGYARAFPEGLPFGVEKRALDLVLGLARRLFGAVVTDTGVRLEPMPQHQRDLIVTSPHRVDVESLLAMLRMAERDIELVSGDDTTPGLLLAADADPDRIEVRVTTSARPVALRNLGWLDRAVDYEIVHLLADEEEDGLENPSDEIAARWTAAYERIGRIAGVLVENLGGYVTDRDGFLVDPADLI